VSAISAVADGVRIRIRVQPRAARTEVAGPYGDAIRIRLAAPPVDGAANEALERFLAACLGVPRAAVALVSGHAGRSKVVEVRGVTPAEATAALAQ
jgi:uncharacterized protein (TIGR00251 family)